MVEKTPDAGDVIAWIGTHQDFSLTESELARTVPAPVASVRYALRQLDERGWASKAADGKWSTP